MRPPPLENAGLEVRLLKTLMLNAGQVLPTEQLISAVWGADGGDRTMLKQLVYRLRAEIEPNPVQRTYIETVPSVGYSLVVPRS